MSEVLSSDQIADLAGISQICRELGADLVVIDATSLLLHMGDLGRFTRDVDLTVALDLQAAGNCPRVMSGHGQKANMVFCSA
jgi:hypothetical protein